MGKLLLCIRVQQAVCKSSLDRETRHLLMVMAVLADWHTGVGTASQGTIAQAIGCTDRHVRKLLSDLAERKDSPVTVIRRRRGAAAGRHSDQYTLSFVDPTPPAEPEHGAASGEGAEPEQYSSSAPEPNRNSVPLGEPFRLVAEPEQYDSRTGTPRHPKRNARSDDQISSDLSQISSSAPRQVSRAESSKVKRGEKPPVEGAHELKLHYVAELERATGTKPEFGKGWGRAVKAFGDLVTAYGLGPAKRIVSTAIAASYGSKTPWAIRDNAVNHLGANSGPARSRAPAPQRSDDQERTKSWGKSGALADALELNTGDGAA